MILFKPEPKQDEFMKAVFSGLYRFLFYGGAAGGGKTYVGLAILIVLCKLFPNSKWMVLRKDFTKLKANTIPSFHKIYPRRFLLKFVDGIAYMRNGSQIIFKGEHFNYDKDLTWMDGLEVNGFLLEEVQELQEKTFNKAKLRAGRNILPNMPPILILCTGNPSQNWSKDVFVTPFVEGRLEKPFYYLQSLMTDNSYLPQNYIDGLDTLDSKTYKRYVQGDWSVIDVDMPFMYDFHRNKHVRPLGKPSISKPLYLSFDFNLDPITCVVFQFVKGKYIHFFTEYRLPNSNTYNLVAAIKKDHPGFYFVVTGDASGTNGNTMVRENVNNYTIIMEGLGIKANQMKVPNENPDIKDNRVLCNAILMKHPEVIFDTSMKFTIDDMELVEVNRYGEINKTKDKHMTHLLDAVRYAFNTHFSDFVRHKI